MCHHFESYNLKEDCCSHQHHYCNHNAPHHYCCWSPHFHHYGWDEDYCRGGKHHSKCYSEHHHHHHEAPHFAHYYECCSQPSKEKLLKFKKHLERIIQKIDQQLAEEEESEN
ncbi:MAG: hypothetical protein WC179_04010 [Candidatus Cloacimonadaceae bacterium]|jgi:hypothetical protein|nr:hypothetical protein [Candidatus Cloacimonadota bacterium]MDD5624143.1 hypothetical protein [Candidatus Cloacimonadota bacterium]MDY0111325.1 hypothetical protein [Candidatus Syntrophosphaera sp.]